MVIGIDGSRAFVEGRTGTENYSYQLIRNMSLIDTENRYLIYLRPGQESKVKSQSWPDNLHFKTINFSRLWTQLGLALQTFIDPLDILFVPAHTLPLLRRPGLKTVVTVHDLGAEYLPGLHQLKQVLYLKMMTHYQIKTATKVISVSKATKEDLVKRVGMKPSQVEVIYEGIDKTVFRKISTDIQKKSLHQYNLQKNDYFLFVGTIQPRKNLARLIRAFSRFLYFQKTQKDSDISENQKLGKSESSDQSDISDLLSLSEFPEKDDSDINLVLVGGKGWKSDEIYKLPKELGIEEYVRFLGRISDEDLAAIYNSSLGLVYPSLFEGFGLPIIEAFACGCPVITSKTSSMPEVAGDGAILVNPESEEEIFNAMRQLYSNDTLRNTLIKKGIVRLGKFDWKKTAKQTIEVLKETISK